MSNLECRNLSQIVRMWGSNKVGTKDGERYLIGARARLLPPGTAALTLPHLKLYDANDSIESATSRALLWGRAEPPDPLHQSLDLSHLH